jgi:HK97 family phage prohead protease
VLEKRQFSFDRLEFRSNEGSGQRPKIEGVAATYGILSQALPLNDKGDTFVERIMLGAFDEAVKANDIKAYWNHNSACILGRFSNKTLEIRLTNAGLEFTSLPPVGVSYVNDLRILLEEKYVFQCSFGFYVYPGGDRWLTENGLRVREVIRADLREVSVVTDPAYLGATTAAVRSYSAFQLTESRRLRQRRAQATFLFRSQAGRAPRS